MDTFQDQIGREIKAPKPIERIISLVPSLTELLSDIGLNKEVVGITKFCVHPENWTKEKTIIGGTKKLHLQKILDLSPDLIIANKEENNKEDIEELEKHCSVYVTDIKNLEDCYHFISDMGYLCDRSNSANRLLDKLKTAFQLLDPIKGEPSVAYCIWKDPYMFAGNNTFIDYMLELAGFNNILKQKRYPELSLNELKDLDPDYVLLSSEPFPFQEKHLPELREYLPNTSFIIVDGEIFSWYGSRLLKFPGYIRSIRTEFKS